MRKLFTQPNPVCGSLCRRSDKCPDHRERMARVKAAQRRRRRVALTRHRSRTIDRRSSRRLSNPPVRVRYCPGTHPRPEMTRCRRDGRRLRSHRGCPRRCPHRHNPTSSMTSSPSFAGDGSHSRRTSLSVGSGRGPSAAVPSPLRPRRRHSSRLRWMVIRSSKSCSTDRGNMPAAVNAPILVARSP
jgi:hypothetical protein